MLQAELKNDPLRRGYSGMTDQEATDSLNSADRQVLRPISIAEVLRWAAGVDAISKLKIAAGSGNRANRGIADSALAMLSSAHIDSLDVTDPEVMGLVDALVSGGVFDAADKTALVARSTQTISRAEELGLGVVRTGEVQEARRLNG